MMMTITKSFRFLPFLILSVFFAFNSYESHAQVNRQEADSSKYVIIVTFEGIKFSGKLLYQDSKEVLIETSDRGEISIPKYQIEEMTEISAGEWLSKQSQADRTIFDTRYFLSTNGLPIEKGDNYMLINLYGPEFQFGVSDNFSIGVMTSWFAIPVIASAKYSFELDKKVHLGLGALVGTGSWAFPSYGGALPFAALTIGDSRSNINFSGGYGVVWGEGDSGQRALLSVAGATPINKKVSFVFDSFIIPGVDTNGIGMLIIPGLRFQTEANKAFQFGFAGLVIDGEAIPLPIPMVQWFRRL